MTRKLALCLALTLGPAFPALARDTTLKAADGTAIHAVVEGTGTTGVVLLHGAEGSAADWAGVIDTLASRGLRVVAVDLRGHGTSQGDAADTANMAADVNAAVAYLKSKGATRVGLVGAGFGSAVALHVAAADAEIGPLVLLGPTLSAPGFSIGDDLEKLGDCRLMIIAGADDPSGSRAAKAIAGKAKGPGKVELVGGARGDIDLIRRSAKIEGSVVGWFTSAEEAEAQQATLSTGELKDVETTGKKFGE